MNAGATAQRLSRLACLLARLGAGALLAGCGAGSTPVAVTAPPAAVVPPPPSPPLPPSPPPPSLFDQVHAIVQVRCVPCHSVAPTMPGFSVAPRGIRFDTPAQIRADALRIYYNVVTTEFMPYGNRTNMTPDERKVIGAWYEGGAR